MKLKDFPAELTSSRQADEASFIFCLWKQPDLYDDYKKLNENGDETIITQDGRFYFSLGRKLSNSGLRSFDNISIYAYLEGKEEIKEEFEYRGGFKTVQEIISLVDAENVSAYFDKIVKQNTLMLLHTKGFNVLQNIELFNNKTSQDVYDYYDYHLNNIAIDSGHNIKIEDLEIDEAFIDECAKGDTQGVAYGKVCKILNYLTLGVPLGDLYMVGGFSGSGKSSFVFENMLLTMVENGTKCVVISNEQRSKDYKFLVLIHILCNELNYWKLTRKDLKVGKFTDEQKQILKKTIKISKEKYGDDKLKFVKLFDNDIGKVKKVAKKLARLGYQVFLYDTFKSEDTVETSAMWQELMLTSRQLFQLASKENIAVICTYQLALHSLNRRYLDSTCLSVAKSIKEVYSEMIYFRDLFDDEYPNEKYDAKIYVAKKGNDGKYEREYVTELNRDRKHIVVFLDKTRNDEGGKQVVYEWNSRFNKWKELGYAKIINTDRK